MLLLPTNLATKLIEDSLPWNCATQFHISTFLETYTLHDSLWITLHVSCGWEDTAVAVISFDPVWNKAISTPAPYCADWPLLFLRFTCVSGVQLAGFSEIGGIQRGVSLVDVEYLSEEEVVTTVIDHYSASVKIQHLPLRDALVMGRDERVIHLPNDAD